MKVIEVKCEYCGITFKYLYHGGPRRKTCSGSCRNKRDRLIASEKEVPRWKVSNQNLLLVTFLTRK